MLRAVCISFILALLISPAGCVKIETGQTVEEAQQSSEQRAGRLRATWANKLSGATPTELAIYLTDHFDQTTDMFFRYGERMTQQWEAGSEGRGTEIKAAEMRQVIDAWIAGEKPLLKAYEDNLEYGFARIKETGHYDEAMLRQLGALVEKYYEIYSAVFYPVGNLEDYAHKLEQTKYAAKRMSEETRSMLSGF
ncbi:MAG: hypothetical protein KAU36_01380 [candidate division Zixibacteria bacterium]|nr:hypothetical protein [candidate division Zixibacteria bacterium]